MQGFAGKKFGHSSGLRMQPGTRPLQMRVDYDLGIQIAVVVVFVALLSTSREISEEGLTTVANINSLLQAIIVL